MSVDICLFDRLVADRAVHHWEFVDRIYVVVVDCWPCLRNAPASSSSTRVGETRFGSGSAGMTETGCRVC